MNKFWMVIRDIGIGSNQTRTRHYTLAEAMAEAERLCRKENADFIVLEARTYCHLPETPLEWTAIWCG